MDFRVGDIRSTAIPWARICEFVPDDLARQAGSVAWELWDKFQFELRDGTNGFGDDFAVLSASATYEEYLDLKRRRKELSGPVQALARVVMAAADELIRFVSF